jgi:crotonobetainyl-CoA:carnitine CoA-transferase CaiB-like acyl-CoA transferase
VFPTRDGELMIVAGNDKLFVALCGVLGLQRDERFATNPQRVAQRTELAALIEERTREWTTDELLQALVAAGIPASPVRDVGEAAEHEQTRALGILQQLGDFTTVAQPVSFDGERLLHRSPPPRHTTFTK